MRDCSEDMIRKTVRIKQFRNKFPEWLKYLMATLDINLKTKSTFKQDFEVVRTNLNVFTFPTLIIE